MNIDSTDLDAISRQAKAALRRRMRSVRGALPPSAVGERSRRVVERVTQLSEVQSADCIGLYWPIEGRGEVDVRPLHAWLFSRNKALYYPFVDRTESGFLTGFRRVDDPTKLVLRGRRFREPPVDAIVAQPGELDVVVVPALAADPRGHRLGYGSGFYDVTLPEHCPPGAAVVVVYQFQLLAELPTEKHDQRVALVVTDTETLRP